MSTRTRVAPVALGVLLALTTAAAHAPIRGYLDLAPQHTTVRGGAGGSSYTIRCPAGSVLTGISSHAGLWLDYVRLLCTQVKSDGTLGGETVGDGTAGGNGGLLWSTSRCGQGVVAGGTVKYGSFVHKLELRCYAWSASERSFDRYNRTAFVLSGAASSAPRTDDFSCTSAKQPVVGIRGREGDYVDAIGFICDEP